MIVTIRADSFCKQYELMTFIVEATVFFVRHELNVNGRRFTYNLDFFLS